MLLNWGTESQSPRPPFTDLLSSQEAPDITHPTPLWMVLEAQLQGSLWIRPLSAQADGRSQSPKAEKNSDNSYPHHMLPLPMITNSSFCQNEIPVKTEGQVLLHRLGN